VRRDAEAAAAAACAVVALRARQKKRAALHTVCVCVCLGHGDVDGRQACSWEGWARWPACLVCQEASTWQGRGPQRAVRVGVCVRQCRRRTRDMCAAAASVQRREVKAEGISARHVPGHCTRSRCSGRRRCAGVRVHVRACVFEGVCTGLAAHACIAAFIGGVRLSRRQRGGAAYSPGLGRPRRVCLQPVRAGCCTCSIITLIRLSHPIGCGGAPQMVESAYEPCACSVPSGHASLCCLLSSSWHLCLCARGQCSSGQLPAPARRVLASKADHSCCCRHCDAAARVCGNCAGVRAGRAPRVLACRAGRQAAGPRAGSARSGECCVCCHCRSRPQGSPQGRGRSEAFDRSCGVAVFVGGWVGGGPRPGRTRVVCAVVRQLLSMCTAVSLACMHALFVMVAALVVLRRRVGATL
jgi:hypothetical protein